MRFCPWYVLLLPSVASAGDHRELCDKVDAATAVVELHFDQVADWPADYREKFWAPPARELLKTAKTGTVTHVFKGGIAVGSPWHEDWGTHFSISGMGDWKTFMALDEFHQVWFMDGKGGTTGWAEESAGCGSSDQDSWCDGYELFKTQLRACLTAEPESPLPEPGPLELPSDSPPSPPTPDGAPEPIEGSGQMGPRGH